MHSVNIDSFSVDVNVMYSCSAIGELAFQE